MQRYMEDAGQLYTWSCSSSSYLRIIILQVIEVCLGFEEQLHDGRGVWHELVTEQKDVNMFEA